MVSRDKVIDWLDNELRVEHFMDAGDNFNGALVKGTGKVGRVGLCVNTTIANIDHAHKHDLDFAIAHHGGWEDFDQDLLQEKKQRLEEYGITWYIAHASLDCADEYGVAATLAKKLGIEIEGSYAQYEGGEAGRYGKLGVSEGEFIDRLKAIDDYEVVGGELQELEDAQIGVIGGSGGVFTSLIKETVDVGCDVLITGNSSFNGDIYAYEKGLTMVTLEETSSEKWGVYALGRRLRDRFSDIELHKMEERNW
jgi:putative NIF3 family GTP cyclohydrolase 1 type 2